MPAEIVNVIVTVQPRKHGDAVTLWYAEPCHHCGVIHHHGNATAEPDADGTYGTRVPHCPGFARNGQRINRPTFTVRLLPLRIFGEGTR